MTAGPRPQLRLVLIGGAILSLGITGVALATASGDAPPEASSAVNGGRSSERMDGRWLFQDGDLWAEGDVGDMLDLTARRNGRCTEFFSDGEVVGRTNTDPRAVIELSTSVDEDGHGQVDSIAITPSQSLTDEEWERKYEEEAQWAEESSRPGAEGRERPC